MSGSTKWNIIDLYFSLSIARTAKILRKIQILEKISIYLSIFLCVCLPVCPFVCLCVSVCLPIYVSVRVSVCASILPAVIYFCSDFSIFFLHADVRYAQPIVYPLVLSLSSL